MVSQIQKMGRSGWKTRRGLVLGCGGTLGNAWSLATLFELSKALSWDPRTADLIVGSSAGAGLAMLLGAGVSVEALLDAQLGVPSAIPSLASHFAAPPPAWPKVPWGRSASPSLLAGLRRGVPLLTALAGLVPEGHGDTSFLDTLVDAHVPGAADAWVRHPGTRIVAADFDTGARVLFGAQGAPRASMRDAIRAAWAIPGFFPSVSIGGRRYADGGIVSPASVDLAAGEGVDEIVVLAPMSSTEPGPRRGLGRIEGLVRTAMRRTLDAEISMVRARGIHVLRLEPAAEDLAVLGPNFMDGSRRLAVLESSLRTARRNVRAALARDGAFPEIEARTEGTCAWQA